MQLQPQASNLSRKQHRLDEACSSTQSRHQYQLSQDGQKSKWGVKLDRRETVHKLSIENPNTYLEKTARTRHQSSWPAIRAGCRVDLHQQLQRVHGIHRGTELYTIFNNIYTLIASYPDEFIVLNFKYESKSRISISHTQLSDTVVSMNKAFSNVYLTDDDYNGWFKRGQVSIAELIKTMTILLTTIHRIWLDQLPENRRTKFKQFIRSHNIFLKPDVISIRWNNC